MQSDSAFFGSINQTAMSTGASSNHVTGSSFFTDGLYQT